MHRRSKKILQTLGLLLSATVLLNACSTEGNTERTIEDSDNTSFHTEESELTSLESTNGNEEGSSATSSSATNEEKSSEMTSTSEITESTESIEITEESTREKREELSEEERLEAMNFYTSEADKAQDALWKEFWDESRGYLRREFPHQEEDKGIDYWWFAHAIDVLVDGYERSGDSIYLERADKVAKGVYDRTGNSFINNFFDDMEWMGLALLRYYDNTSDTFYLENAQRLFEEISEAWSGIAGGGIAWNRESLNFKNTPSNAPAVMLAVRLYERTQESAYADWAHKIFDYLHEYLREDNGYIIDGIRSANEDEIIRNAYTYNHGTYIGAASEMYRLTGDKKYLQYADETFDNAVETYSNSRNIIRETGEGDGGLFKGILMRYVSYYYFTSPDKPGKVLDWLSDNANSVAERAVNPFGLIADRWSGPFKREQHLSSHLSGVKVLEAAWRVHSNENQKFVPGLINNEVSE